MTDSDGFDRGDFLFFSGVFAVVFGGLVIHTIVVPSPHGPLPLVTATLIVCLYESPIVDRWKNYVKGTSGNDEPSD